MNVVENYNNAYADYKNMNKQLYYIRENDIDMVVSVDEFNQCRYLSDSTKLPELNDTFEETQKAMDFLYSITTDKSWKDDREYSNIFTNNIEIIAAIKKVIMS